MRPEEASGKPVGGVDYPRNLAEFEVFFASERDCLLYLARLRWPVGFRCPRCGHDHYWLREDGLLLCCRCRRKTSITAGTLFEGSRLGASRWFKAMWYVVQSTNGVSALTLQRLLGFGSYETAWAWLQKLRRAMEPTSGKLRGEVEVDESFIGGVEEGVRGRETLTKAKVIIAVERRGKRMSAGRVRMRRISDFNTNTLIGFIEEVVEPGSTIVTDGLPQYRAIARHGYIHQRHVIKGSGKKAHELLPAVHRVSALAKRWLLGTHQGAVRLSHLDYYLAEWCFRFNRRRSGHRGLLFHNLVKQAAQTPPQPYTELLAPGAGARRRAKEKTDRERRAAGPERKPARNVPRRSPKRPGGSRNRLADEAERRRGTMVSGRRGTGRRTLPARPRRRPSGS